MRTVVPLCVVGVFVAAFAAGCGREAYERRLDESKRYFTYLDRLNQNLSPQWVGRGVKLRVPKQFEVIPERKPKPKKGAAKGGGKEAPKDAADPPVEERDPRQPTFAEITLPGLVGAFSTKLATAGKGREMGYLYVLTNGELLGRKGSDEKAAQFNNTVIHTIAQAVGQPDPPPEKLVTNSVPKGEPWVPKRTFKMVRPGFPASIPPEKDYRIEIYNCKEQKNEVSLVYVLPENVSPTEKLATNIDLSLETLQITGRSATAGSPEAKAAAGRGL
ncbi:MAG TPA: hypothetical protein VG055_02950 [Planctomycetaceae bacterium]|jgi:hypothetical protein|nr:hypothetical protein [Planctomycetaceae bacterium]